MQIIPDTELKKGYKDLVHVEGWNKAATFHFLEFIGPKKKLITPKTRRIILTENNLLTTHKNNK